MKMRDFYAPDVGTIFEYDGRRYRVNGWLKEQEPPKSYDGQDEIDRIIADILYQTQQEIGPKKLKLRSCFRKDATHVHGSGVSGCVAPIENIKIVGRVTWPEKDIDELRATANRAAAFARSIN